MTNISFLKGKSLKEQLKRLFRDHEVADLAWLTNMVFVDLSERENPVTWQELVPVRDELFREGHISRFVDPKDKRNYQEPFVPYVRTGYL